MPVSRVTVEVEHHDEDDVFHTRYKVQKYIEYGNKLQNAIGKAMQRENILHDVRFNPGPPPGYESYQNVNKWFVHARHPEKRVRYPRLGAFEITLRCPPNFAAGLTEKFQVWSKLTTKRWPDVDRLAGDIARLIGSARRNEDFSDIMRSLCERGATPPPQADSKIGTTCTTLAATAKPPRHTGSNPPMFFSMSPRGGVPTPVEVRMPEIRGSGQVRASSTEGTLASLPYRPSSASSPSRPQRPSSATKNRPHSASANPYASSSNTSRWQSHTQSGSDLFSNAKEEDWQDFNGPQNVTDFLADRNGRGEEPPSPVPHSRSPPSHQQNHSHSFNSHPASPAAAPADNRVLEKLMAPSPSPSAPPLAPATLPPPAQARAAVHRQAEESDYEDEFEKSLPQAAAPSPPRHPLAAAASEAAAAQQEAARLEEQRRLAEAEAERAEEERRFNEEKKRMEERKRAEEEARRKAEEKAAEERAHAEKMEEMQRQLAEANRVNEEMARQKAEGWRQAESQEMERQKAEFWRQAESQKKAEEEKKAQRNSYNDDSFVFEEADPKSDDEAYQSDFEIDDRESPKASKPQMREPVKLGAKAADDAKSVGTHASTAVQEDDVEGDIRSDIDDVEEDLEDGPDEIDVVAPSKPPKLVETIAAGEVEYDYAEDNEFEDDVASDMSREVSIVEDDESIKSEYD